MMLTHLTRIPFEDLNIMANSFEKEKPRITPLCLDAFQRGRKVFLLFPLYLCGKGPDDLTLLTLMSTL